MAADVSALKREVHRWAVGVAGTAVDLMIEPMRAYAPYQTGELRDSIQVDRAAGLGVSSDAVAVRVIAPVIQACTTDQGSPPHRIVARNSRLLVFEGSSGTVFTPAVNHPGNAARPWWQRALEATWGPNLRFAALRTPFGR